MSRKPASAGTGAVVATLSYVSICDVRPWGRWGTLVAGLGSGGAGGLGDLTLCIGPTGIACIGCFLVVAASLDLLAGGRRSWSDWTWRILLEDARAWIMPRIPFRSTGPDPGVS